MEISRQRIGQSIYETFYNKCNCCSGSGFKKTNSIRNLVPYLKNDKKNEDEKINFILLKKIGTTTKPNKNKIKLNNLKLNSKLLLNRNF